jgi:hypothetical protein
MQFLIFCTVFAFVHIAWNVAAISQSKVVAQWTVLNYTWDATHRHDEYVRSKKFIPQNCAMAGINVDKAGAIYVTVPRWRSGVPATLNKLEVLPGATEYTLTPYPSWDMQVEGKEGDLQSCQSMTIDSQGRMWVIETGRRNFLSPLKSRYVDGAAGVWIIDMATDTIISKYYFPADVASYDVSFVNDIVLDESRDLAYLSDAGGNGGIIVYNHKEGTSRRYSSISTKNEPDYVMIIDGVNYGNTIFTTPSDGIALTTDMEAILYGAVQGTKLYRVPTSVLRDFASTTEEIDAAVELLGTKNPSDGMKYVNGVLYYGDLPGSCYHALNVTSTSHPDIATEAQSVAADPDSLRWVSTSYNHLGLAAPLLTYHATIIYVFLCIVYRWTPLPWTSPIPRSCGSCPTSWTCTSRTPWTSQARPDPTSGFTSKLRDMRAVVVRCVLCYTMAF